MVGGCKAPAGNGDPLESEGRGRGGKDIVLKCRWPLSCSFDGADDETDNKFSFQVCTYRCSYRHKFSHGPSHLYPPLDHPASSFEFETLCLVCYFLNFSSCQKFFQEN